MPYGSDAKRLREMADDSARRRRATKSTIGPRGRSKVTRGAARAVPPIARRTPYASPNEKAGALASALMAARARK